MKSKLLLASVAVLGLAFTLNAAEDGKGKGKGKGDPSKRVDMLLKAADTDGNGTLNAEEFAASKPGKMMTEKKGADAAAKVFAKMDADGNGELDKAELSKMGGGKGKGKGDKGGKGGKGKAE